MESQKIGLMEFGVKCGHKLKTLTLNNISSDSSEYIKEFLNL